MVIFFFVLKMVYCVYLLESHRTNDVVSFEQLALLYDPVICPHLLDVIQKI